MVLPKVSKQVAHIHCSHLEHTNGKTEDYSEICCSFPLPEETTGNYKLLVTNLGFFDFKDIEKFGKIAIDLYVN